ncbi:MAG TPA: 1,4-alpha-glucan branching protein GlgB [Actinomycetota bacterium]|nr:1,4-alpha-glucan branching protein GlgB [Actinomycetota bacterium]
MRKTNPTAVDLLVRGELSEPHRLLGAHPDGNRTIVRAWRPEAQSVVCLTRGEIAAKLEQVHPAGLFEATVEGPVENYEFEVNYPDGSTFTIKDPYSFLPTLGDLDLHLIGEGRHRRLHQKLGAHLHTEGGVSGVAFAVWAPSAKAVRVVGNFNSWDGRLHPMRTMGASGVWELFVPDIGAGTYYKFEIVGADGSLMLKTDPFGFQTEGPPGNACIVHASEHEWHDADYLAAREGADSYSGPMSIYEVHLGSWRRTPDGDALSYRDIAPVLADYCREMGFTHVEFLPIAEHPFTGSWGYQVSNYFAPSARYGSPDDFRHLVDALHQEGVGVIVDWVPAHFPKDDWALARFDGTALYEHLDPRRGEHPDWGTLIFNYGRNEVRNFLISNALYWIEDLHIDGLRVDAVASMLYLDYSRQEGEWVPNPLGGRENIEAIEFLKELNTVIHSEHPGVVMLAEESTAWPGVSRPVHVGGLGFGFKWNMGWMHDTLSYFTKDPVYRKFHHNQLTFSLWYAFSENFVLPLSHDEVVHGKGSMIAKMPGDRWQALANLRGLYGYMWAHPGKQLLFMGDEFAQSREWNHDHSLDWHLLDYDEHQGVQRLVGDLNKAYRGIPALWELDFSPDGFRWIDPNDADNNVISFFRTTADGKNHLVCVCNFSPIPRRDYRLGLPAPGGYLEVLNTDAETYGGSNTGNMGTVEAETIPWHGLDYSAPVTLPPLGVIWLRN